MNALVIVLVILIGMFPGDWLLKPFYTKKQIAYVRSDLIGTAGMWEHIKEPRFFLMVLIDALKGLGVVYLAMRLSEVSLMPLFALTLALIAHNFNLIKGFRNGIGAIMLLTGFLLIEPWASAGMVLAIPLFRLFLKNYDIIMVLSVISLVVMINALIATPSAWMFSMFILISTIAYKALYYKQMNARSFNEDYIKRNPFVHKKDT